MNTENVFNNSGIIVSNPNYNPKQRRVVLNNPSFIL